MKSLIDYFKKIAVQYKLDKDKVPPYYVNESGGLYAKSDEVFHHQKVQEDLKHYINIKMGADLLAAKWAYENNTHVAEVRALWSTRGKSAGHARNAAMLLLEPEVVVAFNGGVGTEMMVKLSSKCESVRHIWDRRTMHIN